MASLALLAFFAVVDGQEHKVADFEILVLDFRTDGSDGAGALVAKDGRVIADLDVALLEDDVLWRRC